MRVSHQSQDRLVIGSRPLWPGLVASTFILVGAAMMLGLFEADDPPWWAGALFMGMGAITFIAFVRRVQIVFDRPAGTITVRRRSVFEPSEIQYELQYLQRAIVQTSDGNHRCAFTLDGGMDAGTHPVTEFYMSGGGAQRITDAINSWHQR